MAVLCNFDLKLKNLQMPNVKICFNLQSEVQSEKSVRSLFHLKVLNLYFDGQTEFIMKLYAF